MSNISGHLFVITGGPGSGKSTLLDAVKHAGFNKHKKEITIET